ncbi:MAG: hypothetical protein KAV69_07770 [Deltaproteobacteria bacterium]|nr:hypothetical protein [Deltaproteobacteria bacterium]
MPYPGRFGRGAEMGRGPYEKCGLLRDTCLPPQKMTKAVFEIPFPYADVEKDGKKTRELTADELLVEVKLWYVPFGRSDDDWNVLFFSEEKKINLKTEWVWRK